MPKRILSPVQKRLALALLVPVVHGFYLIIGNGRFQLHAHCLKNVIDDLIPFNSFFILFYIYWYFFLAGGLILMAVINATKYYQLLTTILTGALVADLIFIIFPTVIIRPVITGSTWSDNAVKAFYKWDCPYNCFPSLHVLYAVIITLFVCGCFKNMIIRAVTIMSCLAIAISTLYVKQHYFWDIISGAILAVGLYHFFTNEVIWKKLFSYTKYLKIIIHQ